jgi:hypothetical protein
MYGRDKPIQEVWLDGIRGRYVLRDDLGHYKTGTGYREGYDVEAPQIGYASKLRWYRVFQFTTVGIQPWYFENWPKLQFPGSEPAGPTPKYRTIDDN